MNEEEYIQWIEDFRKASDTEYQWYFGTNEYINCWDFEDWSVTNLSKEEVLMKIILLMGSSLFFILKILKKRSK